MKKVLFLFSIILLITNHVLSQTVRGFVLSEKGWIMVNEKDEQITDYVFDDESEFNNRRALVMIRGKYYIMDPNGKLLISEKDGIEIFHKYSENRAAIVLKRGSAYTWLDTAGNIIPKYNFANVSRFTSGLAYAREQNSLYYGYVDYDGNWVIQPQFKTVQIFAGDLAIVEYKGKFTYLHKDGTIISLPRGVTAKFESASYGGFFSVPVNKSVIEDSVDEKLWRVIDGKKIGFINAKGKIVIPCQFKKATDFYYGRAIVSFKGKNGRIINTKGEYVSDSIFKGAQAFRDGYSLCKINKKLSFVDVNGNVLKIPAEARPIKSFSEGFAVVTVAGKGFNYIDLKGNYLFNEFFTYARSISRGYGIVRFKNGKWGVINTKGEIVISDKYYKVLWFGNVE